LQISYASSRWGRVFWLFMDVSVNDVPVMQGVICQNWNRIVRSAYLGFVDDFVFWDAQGSADPTFSGLGSTNLEKSDLLRGP